MTNIFFRSFAVLTTFLAVPVVTFAQGLNTVRLGEYSTSFIDLINTYLLPLLIAIAMIVFLWGVYNYFIYGADDTSKLETGKTYIMYGVIGFVVIFSMWGLVGIVSDVFGLSGTRSANNLNYPML
jgi:hypothetical protein